MRAQTTAALAAGVFGVPTIDVDGELFWGFDSFAHVERRLRGEDPVTTESLSKWAHVAPSAVRPGARRGS